jgi:hypothetical protein
VEGCEDMVVDHAAGIVYMACASVSNRVKWWPPVNHYDYRNVTNEQDPIFIYDLKVICGHALSSLAFIMV